MRKTLNNNNVFLLTKYLMRRFSVEVRNLSYIRTHQSQQMLDLLPVLQLSIHTTRQEHPPSINCWSNSYQMGGCSFSWGCFRQPSSRIDVWAIPPGLLTWSSAGRFLHRVWETVLAPGTGTPACHSGPSAALQSLLHAVVPPTVVYAVHVCLFRGIEIVRSHTGKWCHT